MKKMSVKLFVAALLLTGCSSMDMDEILEESVQSNMPEEERFHAMSEKFLVVSVLHEL